MKIKDIRAYRRHLQAALNHLGAGWEPDYIGSQLEKDGQRRFGFFNFFQGGTEAGRDAVANKLRGVLEMAQNEQAIYEITQNAADCGSTDLHLWYDDEFFLALNNGNAFRLEDVKSILDTFSSQKAYRQRPENEGMIGQYGVGFKLFHRLVGRESGLEELLDEGAGPMIFSWSQADQLGAFIDTGESPWEQVGIDERAPWFFKILLTCFPTGPGETVRDIDYAEGIAFSEVEATVFRSWATERLRTMEGDLPEHGSLFFLRLGQGKRKVLDRHMDEIRSCMGVSLHFLRRLGAITVNGERIGRVPLEKIELKLDRSELPGIGFREANEDVELVFAYSSNAGDQLKQEPTLYQFFPMTHEKLGMAYVIHSNGLQKQAQRTELNADSAINEALFQRLTQKVIVRAIEWMERSPDKYRTFFRAVLGSSFSPTKRGVFNEYVQQPLIDFIKQHVPTMDGRFVPSDRVLIRSSVLAIPLEEFGIEKHWFYWTLNPDDQFFSHVKDSGRLGLKEATIEHLLKKVGPDRLGVWMGTLPEDDFADCLRELKEAGVKLTDHAELPVFRMGAKHLSLNDLSGDPTLLKELDACYSSHPVLLDWQPRSEVELALANMAPGEWNDNSAALLYQFTEPKAIEALVERLAEIVLDVAPTGQVFAFMEWWREQQDQPVAAMLRKRLKLRTEKDMLGWEESLVVERFKMTLPSGGAKEMSLQRLLPGVIGSDQEPFNHLRDSLHERGFEEDFLEKAFSRRKENSKQDLLRLGERLASQYANEPLANGCQLAFAVALKTLHPEWASFEQLQLCAADGEAYDVNERWSLAGPSFIDPIYLLADAYADIKDYLGDHWDPLKITGDCVLAARPRLGEAFIPEMLREELDGEQRIAFLNWLRSEYERNETVLVHVRNEKNKPVIEKVLGTDPGLWLLAKQELTNPEERPPEWVLQWADADQARWQVLTGLGLRESDNVTVRWRAALLADLDSMSPEVIELPEKTLSWVVARGGAATFQSASQEKRILDLLKAAGKQATMVPDLRLELDAVESTDPAYLIWKAEVVTWTVFEFPGDLPILWTWESHEVARRHGVKAYAPNDGTKRIYVSAGYPVMVALYILSEGPEAVVPPNVRESYKRVYDRQQGPGPEPQQKTAEDGRPNKGQTLEQQVAHHKERQLVLSANTEVTLAELLNATEWEYRKKLLDRQNGVLYRFKEVQQLPDGVLVLKRPNVDELPYELSSDKDRTILGLKLKLRNRGSSYKAVEDFELLASSEGDVRVRVPDPPLKISGSTVATMELPVEDMLLKTLLSTWEQVAGHQDHDRTLLDLVRDRAPGGQVGFIFGPPGTGKTTELAERLIQMVRDTDAKVLVLTPTNTAADVLYQRIGEKAAEEFNVLNSIHRFGTGKKDVRIEEGIPSVVITTMHRFAFDQFANGIGLKNVDWDHVVFDEASMAPLAHTLLPMLSLPARRGESAWGALGARFLFAGDPFQLMPVALTPSLGDRIDAAKKGQRIRGTATENIFTLAGIDRFLLEEAPKLPGAHIHRLATNYRSGGSIVEVFSQSLYSGGVTSQRHSDDHDITLGGERLPAIRLWSFPVELPPKGDAGEDLLSPSSIIPFDNSVVHLHSAILATRLAVVLAMENIGKRVIIICPYGRQVRICQTLLEPFNEACPEKPGPGEIPAIGISSVHRYQGGEADIVIFLLNPNATNAREDGQLVVGNISLFNDPNLINVAVSRARDVLILLAPEDNISRTGHSGYRLMDHLLSADITKEVDFKLSNTEALEGLLFNGSKLSDRVSILPVRALDLYRVGEERSKGSDLIVLHNKENLNMVMGQDIVLEGFKVRTMTTTGTHSS